MVGVVGSNPISASEATRSRDKALSVSALRSSAKPTDLDEGRTAPFLPAYPPQASASRAVSGKLHPSRRSHASPAFDGQPPFSSTEQTPSLSSRTSSGSSSSDTSGTPALTASTSSDIQVTSKQSPASSNAQTTANARLRLAKGTSPAVDGMLDDALPSSMIDANTPSSSGSKTNHILGPDGELYTQGDAARLGLIIRTACEACRNRKLKCSGTLPENGGCERCGSDGIQCVYSARAPIGRPKKRKVEDREGSTVSSPAKQGKGRAKRIHSASDSLAEVRNMIKREDAGPIDGLAASLAMSAFTSSPALQHMSDATHSSADRLHQRNISHDAGLAALAASHSYDLYASPLQMSTAQHLTPGSSKAMSTPTIWSQNQLSFAATPSDMMTPQSASSASFAPEPQTSRAAAAPAGSSTSADKLPSLDDLSVAAFLQSLDTLEISPAELFQQQQQMQPAYSNGYALGTPFGGDHSAIATPMNPVTASSVQEWTTSSAILQPGLSFAVPADFSWWDLGISGPDSGTASAVVSVPATPSTEPSSMGFSANTVQSQTSAAASSTAHHGHTASTDARSVKPRRPTFSTDQLWPRGADAGMGQGQIQHAVAATETGLGWSTLPGHSLAETLSSPVESQQRITGEVGSCCSSKSAKANIAPPAEARDEQHASRKPSCCSAKAAEETKSTTEEKPASCCAGKSADQGTVAAGEKPASCRAGKFADKGPPSPSAPEPVRSCCSNPTASPSTSAIKPSPDLNSPIAMGPLSTSAAITNTAPPSSADRAHSHPSKVHCVPNPSGKGCTCLCDMSVALLSVKQVLRDEPSSATDTIQLTLTASQAITAQCACSTDCPTCQSDPSTEISASLLVSTALQIYARAVRILREGFQASQTAMGGVKGFGGLEVTIGTYKPSAGNAKRIALYAIKLELKDLRRALGRVSSVAQSFGAQKAAKKEEEGKKGMNPIDQLVILKLYRQLTELLKTVEGLEDAA